METPTRSPKGTVSRVRGIRRTAAVLLAVSLPLVAGCAANTGAQTQVQYQPGIGSDYRQGTVFVMNALVVADDNGDGTFVGTLINQQVCPDYLIDFQAVDDQGGGVETSKLPPAEPVQTAIPECGSGTAPSDGIGLPSQRSVNLPDAANLQLHADRLEPGFYVTITMRFQRGSAVELEVPVVPQSNIFATIPVGPIESPAGVATPAATPSG